MKRAVWCLLLLSYPIRSLAICYLDAEPEKLTIARCPGVSQNLTTKNFAQLKSSLARLYHSQPTQTDPVACQKMADLVVSTCKPNFQVKSYFVYPKSGSVSQKYTGVLVNDYRLKGSGTVSDAGLIAAASARTSNAGALSCQQPGKQAVTLSAACGAVTVCESIMADTYVFKSKDGQPISLQIKRQDGSVRFSASGVNVPIGFTMGVQPTDGDVLISSNVEFSMMQKPAKTLVTYPFRGDCNAIDRDAVSLYIDRAYAASGNSNSNPRNSVTNYCPDGISMCSTYRGPILNQSSPDLLQLISAKANISNSMDVGFCGPTSATMALMGLKDQSKAQFGGPLDAGSTYTDPVDSKQGSRNAAAILRAGQLVGTDFFIGGTPSDQNATLLKGNLGDASGTLDEFMGTNSDYNNSNWIKFANKFGGLSQLFLAMDSTDPTRQGVWHSVMMAGHAGGHLQIYDPWGRTYLVDIEMKPRDAIFYKINSAFLNYDNGSGRVFNTPPFSCSMGPNCVATYTFASAAPKVGELYPAWWWEQSGSREAIAEFERLGAVTKVVRSGTAVPHIKHLSGDQGFVYYSPSNQAQMLVGQEVAMVNPGRGKFFDAAEAQNVTDILDGSGQRARGAWQLKCNYAATDGEVTRTLLGGPSSSTISGAPRFITELKSTGVNEGKSLTLSAVVKGCPAPTYQWFRNGVAISGATQSSYTISAATSAHEGVYKLLAQNSVGSVFSVADVIVNSKQDIQKFIDQTIGSTGTSPISTAADNWYALNLSANLLSGALQNQNKDIVRAYQTRVGRPPSQSEILDRLMTPFTSYDQILNSIRIAAAPMTLSSSPVNAGMSVNLTYAWSMVPYQGTARAIVKFVDEANVVKLSDDHDLPFGTSVATGRHTYSRSVAVPATLLPGTYNIHVSLVDKVTGVIINTDPAVGVTSVVNGSEHRVGKIEVLLSELELAALISILNSVITGD